MSTYVIKTGYGQEAAKKIRIFKLTKTATISTPQIRNGGFQKTDPQGQSVMGFTRPYPAISCEGGLVQAGPIGIEFDSPTATIIVDFPSVDNLPMAVCSAIPEVKNALAVRDVRMLEAEWWTDGSTV